MEKAGNASYNIKVNTKNDPLLRDDRYSLFAGDGIINIYRILSAYGKDIGTMTDLFCLEKNCKVLILGLLRKRYGNLDNAIAVLLTNLEAYGNRRYASRIKEKWRAKDNLLKGHITLKHARVISLILTIHQEDSIGLFNRLLLNSRYLIRKKRRVRYPLEAADLNDELAYLAGVIAGDGHIEKDLHEMKMVDGHRDKTQKKYSKQYLKKINEIIKRNFMCVGRKERVKGNYYVLRYSSSLLCRILNYLYGIPVGNKAKKVRVPKIIKNTPKECLFWRGVFDADGHIRKKNKAVGLSTTSGELFRDLVGFCKNNGITIFNSKSKGQYRILVAEESIPQFARIIGSSHPRKQRNLIGYLENGAYYKIPVIKKQHKKLEKVIRYLRPYKENIYIRLTDRREKTKNPEGRMRWIGKTLNHKIVEVKRHRKNNHFYICSRGLVKEINEHFEFKPLWNSFNEGDIKKLKEKWDIYE